MATCVGRIWRTDYTALLSEASKTNPLPNYFSMFSVMPNSLTELGLEPPGRDGVIPPRLFIEPAELMDPRRMYWLRSA